MTVEVWMACATPSLAEACRGILLPSDLDALNKVRPVERNRRLVQLALRRAVVAERRHCPVENVMIGRDTRGRMVVPGPPLAISAAHHDDVTVIAVSDHVAQIGIDIEPANEADWDAAVEDVLCESEIDALASLPTAEREPAYFACWTLKEAVMKALGEGLSDRDPKTIEVAAPPLPARLISLDGVRPKTSWCLRTIDVWGYFCSLAVPGADDIKLDVRRWPI